MIFAFCSLVWAAAPAPPVWSADELARLAKGEAVVRSADASGEIVGVVDVPVASPGPVMDAVLDFDLRARTLGSVESIGVYAPESDPKGLGTTWVLSILGTKVTYHLRYVVDRAGSWCTFTLDPEREHDIVATNGSYRVDATPGGQRLVYRSRTDTGRPVPGFVKNWLATSSIRDQLVAMRDQVVSRGSGR